MSQTTLEINTFLEPLFENIVIYGQLETKKVVVAKKASVRRIIWKTHTVCNSGIFFKSQDVFRCDRGLDSITLIIIIITMSIAAILYGISLPHVF